MERTLRTAIHSVVSLDDGLRQISRRTALSSGGMTYADFVLHVTNGDCTVEIMRRAHLVGDIVAWQDVLHEGPCRR